MPGYLFWDDVNGGWLRTDTVNDRGLSSPFAQLGEVVRPTCLRQCQLFLPVFCGLLSWSVQFPHTCHVTSSEHPIHVVESKKMKREKLSWIGCVIT